MYYIILVSNQGNFATVLNLKGFKMKRSNPNRHEESNIFGDIACIIVGVPAALFVVDCIVRLFN